MAVIVANSDQQPSQRRVTFHRDTKPGHRYPSNRKELPTDVFPFTVGSSGVRSAPGARSLTSKSAPKYSFRSALRQPITAPDPVSGCQISDDGVEIPIGLRTRKLPPKQSSPAKQVTSNYDDKRHRAATKIPKQDIVKSGSSKTDPLKTPPPVTNLRVGAVGRIIKNSRLLSTITGLPALHATPVSGGGRRPTPRPPSDSTPAPRPGPGVTVPPATSSAEHTLTLSNMLYQTRLSGGDQQNILDLYQQAEAEFQKDLAEASWVISDALKAELQVYDDVNDKIALTTGRYEYDGWPEGQHSYWLYHTNASAPMFVGTSVRQRCNECINQLPADEAREANWRYRLCPHWRRVVFHEGYFEAIYTHGGNQSCPFCGVVRGAQATQHFSGCPFRLARAVDPDINAPEDYSDGLAGDADFDDIRKDPKAFDGKDPKDKGTESFPATLEKPVVSDDGDGSDNGDIPSPPRISPPPHPKSPGHVSPPPDTVSPPGPTLPGEIAAGTVRPLTDKDQKTNNDHYQQVQLVLSRSSHTAHKHHVRGVRQISAVSAANRLHINDIRTALKDKGLARPYWEMNTYIERSTTDFTKDSDFKLRLPDNVVENAAATRKQFNKPNPLSATTNYAGPARVLFKGNETWFKSRFNTDSAAYSKWRAQTYTFADLQKHAPMNTAAPVHPTTFYTEDTLDGVYWDGDNGIMIQAPTTGPGGDEPEGDKPDVPGGDKPDVPGGDKPDEPEGDKPEEPEVVDVDKVTDPPIEPPKKFVKPAQPDGVELGEHARATLEVSNPPPGATKGVVDGKSTNKGYRWCRYCTKRTERLVNKAKKKAKDTHFLKCWVAWPGDPVDGAKGSDEPVGDTDTTMRAANYHKGPSYSQLGVVGSKRKAAEDSEPEESSEESEVEDIVDESNDSETKNDPESSPVTKNITKTPNKRRRKVFKTPEFISSSHSATPTASSPPPIATPTPSSPSRKRKHISGNEEAVRAVARKKKKVTIGGADDTGNKDVGIGNARKTRKTEKDDVGDATNPEGSNEVEQEGGSPRPPLVTPRTTKKVSFETPESQDPKGLKRYRKTPGSRGRGSGGKHTR
ncbi:hypothetical protein TWF696_007428 [Orbilia brochopaga]|uniref:Uncharacterized protein n=1 Tax=Orbilia brochopaga TaxID=3140254 RepID=A0AAV9USU2_9PEZI